MEQLDATDKLIINRIQSDFPITSHPFKTIAEELALTEDAVLERVRRMKATGIIRRIGGNFVPEKVGFVSTLCAAKVPEDKIEALIDRQALKRLGEYRDIVNVIDFFISRESDFVTAQTVYLGGVC